MELYEFQKEAVDKIEADRLAGHKNALAVIPTGGGKTVVGLQSAINYLEANPGKRALWLAHLRDLIFQPAERVAQYWPKHFPHTGIVMSEMNQCGKRLIIATMQTLSAGGRMEQVLENGVFDYVVTDEAHHATSDKYKAIHAALREANPDLFHLGLTATPGAKETNGLAAVYDVTSVNIPLTYLISIGRLATPRWMAIQTGIDIASVKSRRSNGVDDFSDGALADVYDVDNCFDLVVESHIRYGGGRQFIAFVSSVAGAHALAKKFREAGIPTEAGDAKTPKKERLEMLRRVKRGDLTGLVCVGIWTEGLDLPMISMAHIVRPTKNDDLYMQMVGRALRTHPGKTDALILDYAPLESRELVRFGDVLGIPRTKQKSVANTKRGEIEGGFTYDGDVKWLTGDPLELVHRQLDYLSSSPLRWSGTPKEWKVLGLGAGSDDIDRTLAVSPYDADGVAHLWALWKRPGQRWKVAPLMSTEDFEEIEAATDGYCRKWGTAALIGKKQKWHKREPSDSMIAYAERLRIPNARDMTQGELSLQITRALALSTLRRYGVYDNPAPAREKVAA